MYFYRLGDSELFPSLANNGLHEQEIVVGFAAKLSTFLDTAHIKDTVFAVGPLSGQIAKNLVTLSQNSPRRSTDLEAALVIVDRVHIYIHPDLTI